jgi:hemolysin III
MSGITNEWDESQSKDCSPHVTDEVFNTCSHMAAAIFSLLGFGYLVVTASVAAKPWHVVGFSIYGVSLMLLFVASALHHGVNAGPRADRFFRLMDYQAIYLLIAGSFTPICLTVMRGPLGWTVFGVCWVTAAIGLTLNATLPRLPKSITNTLYVTMGWLAVTMGMPLYRSSGAVALGLLALGGVCYSLGAVVFATERPNPMPGRFGFHEIWHIFVIAGALSHYVLMWIYILPTA